MAKGRPVNPDKAKSKSAGHRSAPGKGQAIAARVAPVSSTLANIEPPELFADMPVAADTWRVILSDMATLRTIREVDLPLVLAYCDQAQTYANAVVLKKKGMLVQGPHGPIRNPAYKIANETQASMRLLGSELGITPMARIRGNLMEVATGSMLVDIQERLQKMMDES